MDEVLSFKVRVGKVKMGLIIGEFTVICPNNNLTQEKISPTNYWRGWQAQDHSMWSQNSN